MCDMLTMRKYVRIIHVFRRKTKNDMCQGTMLLILLFNVDPANEESAKHRMSITHLGGRSESTTALTFVVDLHRLCMKV